MASVIKTAKRGSVMPLLDNQIIAGLLALRSEDVKALLLSLNSINDNVYVKKVNTKNDDKGTIRKENLLGPKTVSGMAVRIGNAG